MRLQWLAIGITLIATFSTFGYPLLFDRLFFCLIAVTALISFKWDKNLFTLCIIYIFGLGMEEVGWLLSEGNRYLQVPSYLFLLFACYITRYSKTGKIAMFFATCAIGAELYWLFIGKQGPQIYWSLYICANLLILKHFVLLRPHFCGFHLPKYYDEWQITKADIDLGYIIAVRIVFELLNMLEYLIRHIAELQFMGIYDNYRFIVHAIFAIIFYIFLRAFSETLRNKLFPA